MDAEWKQKWIEALRSGDYTQDNGALRTPTGYCCLGVLCEIHPSMTYAGSSGYRDVNGYTVRGYPSEYLLLAVELSFGSMRRLAKMNDDGRPFPEIADYIERNL